MKTQQINMKTLYLTNDAAWSVLHEAHKVNRYTGFVNSPHGAMYYLYKNIQYIVNDVCEYIKELDAQG